jgi:hypothetical protein
MRDNNGISCCVYCNEPFKEGDSLQAFLRCPEDPDGSWAEPVVVDKEYQARSDKVRDKIRRKHYECNEHS